MYPTRFVQYFSEIEGSKSIRFAPHDNTQGVAWVSPQKILPKVMLIMIIRLLRTVKTSFT